MRLFVAADIDPHTRAQLASLRASFQSVLDRARVPPRITWVKDDAAHVTMQFIGEVAEDTARVIQQALQEPLSTRCFDVRWDRVGTFPGGRNPRVIWIGSSDGDASLQALATAVKARLGAIVGPGDPRPFKGHVTIGRIKEPGRGADWTQAIGAVRMVPTSTHVDHITLYLSRTSPEGPTYTALCRTSLEL